MTAGAGDDEQNRRTSDVMWPLLDQRLTALEKRVDAGFSSIDHKLDTLAFVRADVYAANQVARDQEIANLRAELASTNRLAMWSLSVIGVALLGAVVAGIARMAGLS